MWRGESGWVKMWTDKCREINAFIWVCRGGCVGEVVVRVCGGCVVEGV